MSENEIKSNYIDKSLNGFKKAIIMYNDFLSENRFESFIVFSHIGFNRIFIAYHIHNGIPYRSSKNKKIRDFSKLLQQIYCDKIIDNGQYQLLFKLDELRNLIAHDIPDEKGLKKEKSAHDFAFLALNIYKQILFILDKTSLIEENILVFSSSCISNILEDNISTKDVNSFTKNLREFMKNFNFSVEDEKKNKDIFVLNNPTANSLKLVDETWKKPKELCDLISKKISVKFTPNYLSVMRSYLELFKRKDKDFWENCPGSDWKIINEIQIIKAEYCQKSEISKSILYKKDLVSYIVDVVNPHKDKLKDWIKLINEKKSLYKNDNN